MEKLYIVIAGRRNAGKSSLMNCISGQEQAIVSEVAGTTTDPVKKSYEVPGFASIIFTDTAGTDDTGALGRQRVEKTCEAIKQANAALLVISENRFGSHEEELIHTFQVYHLPFIILHNKSDLSPLQPGLQDQLEKRYKSPVIDFSTRTSSGSTVIEHIRSLVRKPDHISFTGDLVHTGDLVVLVTPIDTGSPTGRMILPQVQTMRDLLDHHCISIVLQPDELSAFLAKTELKPALVITDSQAFKRVAELIPSSIPFTSFSILLARAKGNFENYIQGTSCIQKLENNDRILILESCSHHVSCEDIGRKKIPALLCRYTGKDLDFDFVAGSDPIKCPLTDYAMVIQCGGCMVSSRQLQNRLQPIIDAGVPVSNFGMVIAYTQGIFERAVSLFARPSAK